MEITTEEEFEFSQRLGDKAREANYALWNALLTGNGLILAAATFLSSPDSENRGLLIAVILAAGAGSAAIVLNFRSMQNFYLRLGREYGKILEGKEVDSSTDAAALDHDIVRCRENTAIALITVELLLLLGMIAI